MGSRSAATLTRKWMRGFYQKRIVSVAESFLRGWQGLAYGFRKSSLGHNLWVELLSVLQQGKCWNMQDGWFSRVRVGYLWPRTFVAPISPLFAHQPAFSYQLGRVKANTYFLWDVKPTSSSFPNCCSCWVTGQLNTLRKALAALFCMHKLPDTLLGSQTRMA